MKIFEVSFFGIHIAATWYGFMYAIGFVACFLYMKKYSRVKLEHMDTLLLYIFLGVILGGRIGYALLYDFGYFQSHILEVFMIWKGGMSFHGGALGVIFALILFSYRYHYPIFSISDPLVTILPVALGLGRIGNYLNGELLGFTPYDGPFAMIQNGIAHFPSPLFQAFLEGIILLIIMQLFWNKKGTVIPGYASALFLISYGVLRIFAEIFRLPDAHIGYLLRTQWMTLGMIYTLPLILGGILVFYFAKKQ